MSRLRLISRIYQSRLRDSQAIGPSAAHTRHEIFAREYVKDLNGARAAIAAGYARKTAKSAASRLLTNVNVQAILTKLTKKQADKLDLSAEKVLSELSRMGFSNLLDYVKVTKEGDAFVDLSNLTPEQAAAIQEVTVDEYMEGKGKDARKVKRTKLKLVDKIRSLELLGKHLKLFTERIEVSGTAGLAEALAAARKRANMRER